MISRLKLPNVKVMSLTTIASPHRGEFDQSNKLRADSKPRTGSAFADYVFEQIDRTLSSVMNQRPYAHVHCSDESVKSLHGTEITRCTHRCLQPVDTPLHARRFQPEDP